MRARIQFKTHIRDSDFEGRLVECGFEVIPWEDSNETALRDSILNRISSKHRDGAKRGARFLLRHRNLGAEGMFGTENDRRVIRVFHEQIIVAQKLTEEIVHVFADYAKRTGQYLGFDLIDILETKNHNALLVGKAISTPAELSRYIRQHRPVERAVSWAGLVVLPLLVLSTLLPGAHPILVWLKDLLRLFIGSIAVTTFVAYLNLRSFRRSLGGLPVMWELPDPSPTRQPLNPSNRPPDRLDGRHAQLAALPPEKRNGDEHAEQSESDPEPKDL